MASSSDQTKAVTANEKLAAQITSCITLCGGSSPEERFAGLLLLSRIPAAHSFLIDHSNHVLATQLWNALHKDNFLCRLLLLPEGALPFQNHSPRIFSPNFILMLFLTHLHIDLNENHKIQVQIALTVLVSVFSRQPAIFWAGPQIASLIIQRLLDIIRSKHTHSELKVDAANFLTSVVSAAASPAALELINSGQIAQSCISSFYSVSSTGAEAVESILKLMSVLLGYAATMQCTVSVKTLEGFISSLCGQFEAKETKPELKVDLLAVLVGTLDWAKSLESPKSLVKQLIEHSASNLAGVSLMLLSSKLTPDIRDLTLTLCSVSQ